MLRLGIYGGSFNPVHYGHINLARRAIEDLSLSRLLVIPASVSPFKTEDDRSILAMDREWELEFLKSAFAELPEAIIDDRELKRGGVSYAIDTVSAIAKENPGAKLFFIIGEDSVAGLPRWKDYEKLIKLCEFKAYPRTEESSTAIRELFAARKVTLNPEGETAKVVREGLLRKGGYCPCRLQKTPTNFCPCAEFRSQLADPDFRGLCHCRLYQTGPGPT